MRIIIDNDACPTATRTIAVELGQSKKIPVLAVASIAHWSPVALGQEVIWVDRESQAADMAIANLVKPGDVVITGDYGLAALVLARRGNALSPRGVIFSNHNLDNLLWERHISAKTRRGGGKTKGPRSLTQEQHERFAASLAKIIADQT